MRASLLLLLAVLGAAAMLAGAVLANHGVELAGVAALGAGVGLLLETRRPAR